MDNKINKLLSFIKGLSNADIDRVLEYVIENLKVNNQQADRPCYPHYGSTHIIKNIIVFKQPIFEGPDILFIVPHRYF